MAITIKQCDETPVVKPVRVEIETRIGVMAGKATPSLSGHGKLTWHLLLNGADQCGSGGELWELLQGFGQTPAVAIADAIVYARKDIAKRQRELDALEMACGTHGLDAAAIADMALIPIQKPAS